MTKDRIVRIARASLPWALAAGACTMATFFDDPNPLVVATAVVAWACLTIATFKADR